MKKKGFTLIELLAVIVILAIIALIATPLVLKYIEKSRKESKVDSAYSFVRNLENEIANYSIKNKGTKFNKQPSNGDYYELGDFEADEDIDTKVKGDKPDNIKVCLSSLGQVDKATFQYDKYYVSYDGKKGSIIDKDTYDNFSCSGSGGSFEPIFSGNVVYEEGAAMAYPSTCIDPNTINFGEYYNIVLTDASGNKNTYNFIAQNSVDGVSSLDDELSIIFANPNEFLYYGYMPENNMCAILNDTDENENLLYSGEYLLEIVPTGEAATPNYVFRIGELRDKYAQLSYISSDLNSGDVVEFQIIDSTTKEVIITLSEEVGTHTEITDYATIYNKKYFKRVLSELGSGDIQSLDGAADVNIIVNGKKIHSFRKDEFTFVESCVSFASGCIGDAHYYVGNEDIASVEGC